MSNSSRIIISRDVDTNMRESSDKILRQIYDDIYDRTIYDEYHIHDFANQHGGLSVDAYVTRVRQESPTTFHIIVLNSANWRDFGLPKQKFDVGDVVRLYQNVILTCVQPGREEDDVVCLRLLYKLARDEDYRYIHDKRIIIKTDDDMTRPQHNLPAIAHRYYNTYINDRRDDIYDVRDAKLQDFYRFLKERTVGSRGIIQPVVVDPAILEARRARFGHNGGGDFKEKYLKYKQKYLELKMNLLTNKN